MQVGHFIWCNFPYDENPTRPGPAPHVVYIADLRQAAGQRFLVCVYTTSRPWRRSETPPFWMIPVHEKVADAIGQRPFSIDASRIAPLPLTREWFPGLDRADGGILPHAATPRMQDAILNAIAQVAKRPELQVALGPRATVRKRDPRGNGGVEGR